jgi:starch synthase
MAERRLRVLFINTGILGHRTVAHVVRESLAQTDLEATYVDLSDELSIRERIVRRLLTVGPRPGTAAGALTGARYRHELNAGLLAARRLRALERRGERFDVIHFHTQAAAWACLGRMRRTPTVVSIDITQQLASLEHPAGAQRLDYAPNAIRDRRVFRAAGAIVATSQWAADDLARDLPECAPRLRVLPYPVPLDGFPTEWPAARRGRQGPVRVLFIGGDFARKGGHDLLAAWRAGDFAARARLIIVTDSVVDVAALPPGVELRRGVRAYTPEWFQLWRDADLFALPTRAEAFGMVFQEAAAAALPSIGTAINAIPEIVVDDTTGVLVPPGDRVALRAALQRLIGSPETRDRMGVAARARIETAGSLASYGQHLAEIIHAAAGRGA